MSEFINKTQIMEHFGFTLVGIRSIISPLEILLVRRKVEKEIRDLVPNKRCRLLPVEQNGFFTLISLQLGLFM